MGEGQLAVSPHNGAGFPPWMDLHAEGPLDVGSIRQVLVVRTDHLGDMLLSTPFIETLRRNLPRSRVTALVTPYVEPALARNPSIDEIVVLDTDRASEARTVVLRQLRARGFDLCVALSPTMRTYAIARAVRARRRAGYVYSRRWVPRALSPVFLTHRAVFHIDALVERGQPVPHEVEQTLWFARALGFAADPVPLRVYPEEHQVRAAWSDLGNEDFAPTPDVDSNLACRRDVPWLAVQLGAAWLKPPWSLGHFVDMLRALRHKIPETRLVVLYGPGETTAGAELAGAGIGPDIVIRGNLSFSRWAGIIGGARILISPDTGSVHVAAAMRTPVVVAYEDATFSLCSQQWAPWMVANRKVSKAYPRNDTIPRLVAAAADLWRPGR